MQKTFTDQQIFDGLLTKTAPLVDAIVRYLYDQCQLRVRRMVTRNNGSDADADDLFQEVIVAFLQNIWDGKFQLRSTTRVTTYIYEIAHLMWLKELRKRASQDKRNERYSLHQSQEQPVAPNPEQELMSEEEINSAKTKFERLNLKCQQVLKAFYFDKKSMKQIADELGLGTEDNAKTTKYRCIVALKKLMLS
ncbi:RNA polymerase sigma factor [Spirosoma endophyticum]|uniref:RNA polymerase sigma factor, sigma-70 family n=1 Tax=Spirosoma endophyticum TaxID=662367 RepID=A0A1I2GHW3_9BACT|nr:sigma-70 family RNA polymerase sigma factor [Spirosoma endophyticum]SFF16336.1 RNA polymerase sigma factor, sigma-70 family [Spirosoma endophyticum]